MAQQYLDKTGLGVVAEKINTINEKVDTNVGDISTLLTDAKTSTVAAINELHGELDAEVLRATTQQTAVEGRVKTIEDKIPTTASATNKLADQAFVNSTVQTQTAHFRGSFASWAVVPSDSVEDYAVDGAGSHTPTENDYMVVQNASDYAVDDDKTGTWRFKYSGVWATNGKDGWKPEYQVNREPLTAAQIAALNSGITAAKVTEIGTKLEKKTDKSTVYAVDASGAQVNKPWSDFATAEQGKKADAAATAIGTVANLTTTAKNLTGAVNEVSSAVKTVESNFNTFKNGAVLSVNGRTGAVVLSESDVGLSAIPTAEVSALFDF